MGSNLLSDMTRGEWTLVGIIFALVVVANLVRRIGAALHRNLAANNLLSDDEARYAGAVFGDSTGDNDDDDRLSVDDAEDLMPDGTADAQGDADAPSETDDASGSDSAS